MLVQVLGEAVEGRGAWGEGTGSRCGGKGRCQHEI